MRFPFTTYIERGDDEIELSVVYDVTPGTPARLYGDYPHPEEPAEVEIISVKRDGQPFATTDAEDAKLQQECEERAGEDMAEEAEAAAEWRAQSRRDERLMEGF